MVFALFPDPELEPLFLRPRRRDLLAMFLNPVGPNVLVDNESREHRPVGPHKALRLIIGPIEF